MRETELYINLAKYSFYKKEVDFLRFIISYYYYDLSVVYEDITKVLKDINISDREHFYTST